MFRPLRPHLMLLLSAISTSTNSHAGAEGLRVDLRGNSRARTALSHWAPDVTDTQRDSGTYSRALTIACKAF